MGGFAEYEQYDGVGLATLIRNGEIKAGDVCEEAIRRAGRWTPKTGQCVKL